MKSVEARDLESEDLRDKLRELKEELFNLRFRLATGQLDNHRRIGTVKRESAMIRTILRERELIEEDEAAVAVSTSPGTSTEGESE